MQGSTVRRWWSAATVACLAGLALAEPPAALDRVPGGAALSASVRGMDRVMSRLRALVERLPMAQDVAGGDLEKLAAMLTLAPGLDSKGSAAVFFMPVGEGEVFEAADERALMIVPVTDAAAFIKAGGGNPADQVSKLRFEGEDARDVFVRDLGGGYLLLGQKADLVEQSQAKAGNMPSHVAMLGATSRIADSADVVTIWSPAALAPMVRKRADEMRGLRGLMGGGMAHPQPEPPDATRAADVLERDAQSAIMALTLGEVGVLMDIGAQFREGTESAAAMSGTSDSASLMTKLPAQAFYLAGAMDLSTGAMKRLLDAAGMEPQDDPAVPLALDRELLTKEAGGVAFSLGQSPGGVMGGTLLSNLVMFLPAKDPAALLNAVRQRGKEMNAKDVGGATVTTEYAQDQPLRDMPDQKVDSWTTTLEFDPNDPEAMQRGMGMEMILGGNKLSGMAAAAEGGVFMTLSKNSRLMRSAINAARNGAGSNTDDTVRAAYENLPRRRTFELYLGVKPVIETIRETFFLEEADLPVPDKVPAIGLAGTTGEGALTLHLFVPNDTIPVIASTARLMRQGPDGADAQDPAPRKTGKPEF
jgi:hypothetical protein